MRRSGVQIPSAPPTFAANAASVGKPLAPRRLSAEALAKADCFNSASQPHPRSTNPRPRVRARRWRPPPMEYRSRSAGRPRKRQINAPAKLDADAVFDQLGAEAAPLRHV